MNPKKYQNYYPSGYYRPNPGRDENSSRQSQTPDFHKLVFSTLGIQDSSRATSSNDDSSRANRPLFRQSTDYDENKYVRRNFR